MGERRGREMRNGEDVDRHEDERDVAEKMEAAAKKLLPEHRRRMALAVAFLENEDVVETMAPLEKMETLAAARELLEMPRERNDDETKLIDLFLRDTDDPELLNLIASASYVSSEEVNRIVGKFTVESLDPDGVEHFAQAMRRAWVAELQRREYAKKFDAVATPTCSVEKIDRMMEETLAAYEGEAPKEFERFSPALQEIIARNIFAVELTEGCSVRCTFCAFDAKREVGRSVPLRDVAWLHRRSYGEQFYYYATDALDYRDATDGTSSTYADVLHVTSLYGAFTSTAYPYAAKDVLLKVIGSLGRLSVSEVNRRRLVQEGYIEVTERGSVIPKDPTLAWSLLAKTRWRDSLYNFASGAMKKYTAGRQRVRPHEDGHANGDVVADSIACRNGVLMGPGKLMNSLRMNSTKEFPNGVLESMLSPADLENGTKKFEAFLTTDKNELLRASDLLACGIVEATNNTVHSVYGSFVMKKSPPATLLTHDAVGGTTTVWRFRYNMTTGTVRRDSIARVGEYIVPKHETRAQKVEHRQKVAKAHWEASEQEPEDKSALDAII